MARVALEVGYRCGFVALVLAHDVLLLVLVAERLRSVVECTR